MVDQATCRIGALFSESDLMTPYFFFGETLLQLLEIKSLQAQFMQVDGVGAQRRRTQDSIKVIVGGLGFAFLK
jgi:hypothetical protein